MATQYEQKCSQCDEADDVFECSMCDVQYCFECEPQGEMVYGYDNNCRYCYACWYKWVGFSYDDESISDPSEKDTSEGEMYSQRVGVGIGA